MPRLAVLISGCSVCLVASWAMVAIHQANQSVAHLPPARGAPVARTVGDAADEGARADALGLQARLKQSPRLDKRREELERNGRQPPAAKKKRMGARGISVDRKNIVETVGMEDLRAPPGRLWIPAALSGPINNKGGDPLFNVLVAYCQLDMVAYHESPWLFAMGAFHQRTSGCLDDPSLTRTYRLSSLKVRWRLVCSTLQGSLGGSEWPCRQLLDWLFECDLFWARTRVSHNAASVLYPSEENFHIPGCGETVHLHTQPPTFL